jgi:quercetin dioxygenase-like cupin family protein
MNIQENFKFLYEEDISKLKGLLENISDEFWGINTLRQDRFSHHKDTNSIIFKWSEFDIEDYNKPKEFNISPLIKSISDEVYRIVDKIGFDYYNKCEIVRLMLVRLPAGCEIPLHTDLSNLEVIHRCHVVIKTNEQCYFKVGNEVRCLKEGDVVEINNQRDHEVSNLGKTERIHIICDFFPIKGIK